MPATHTTAVEDYLKGIFVLEERGGPAVTTTELAKRLGVSVSAVSGMVRRLCDADLVAHRRYEGIGLTPEGRRVATKVLRRRRVIESYLVDALGYEWEEVDAEAELLEHVVSEQMVERMAEHLGHPTRDPHGDPIPAPDGTVTVEQTRPAASLEPGVTGTLARVRDDPPGLLLWLREHGIALGDRVEVTGFGVNGVLGVRVGRLQTPLSFGMSAARSLELAVDGEPRGYEAHAKPRGAAGPP